MSKETLIEKINKKFGEIQKIVDESGDKDFAVFAVATDQEQSSQLAVGNGANINLAMCNAMNSTEVAYFAIKSSSILFDCYQDDKNPEEVMEALNDMRSPTKFNKPKTEA